MSGRRVLALYGALLLGFAAVLCTVILALLEHGLRRAGGGAERSGHSACLPARGNFYDCGGLPLTGHLAALAGPLLPG